MMKINWVKLAEHAALIALAAFASDIVAHVPVGEGGLVGVVLVALRYALDALKTTGV